MTDVRMIGSEFKTTVDIATAALAKGDAEQAYALSSTLLNCAKTSGHLTGQAWAFYLLGRTEHLNAQLSSALSLAQQASHLFHVVEDPGGELAALALVVHMAWLLGLHDEAIENGTLSIQLAEPLPMSPYTAMAYNCLGFASIGVDAHYADRALIRAIKLAHEPTLAHQHIAAQAQLNRVLNELFRLENCLQSGQSATLRPDARASLEAFKRLRHTQDLHHEPTLNTQHDPLAQGIMHQGVQPYADFVELGLIAFEGPPKSLASQLHPAQQPLATTPPWGHPLCLWLMARCALNLRELELALSLTHQAVKLAQQQGQSYCLVTVLYLQAQIYEALNRLNDALETYRQIRHHQMHTRTANIANRERAAALRLAWRQQTQTLIELQSNSRQLERLSLEDSLTGLANRRQLEKVLADLLAEVNHPLSLSAETDRPWCLVMLDIDGFKQINDRHSHVLGDEVLRQVGQLLREIVRQQDLAARLAGDEFVLILRDTTEDIGLQVLQRLSQRIEQFDWPRLEPGLEVTVSMGLAQVELGDTHASLLRRSDARMYADKARKLRNNQPLH